MEMPFLKGRRPLPLNPDLVRGLPTTRLCTDIVAPELMDVQKTDTCTYPLYQAPPVGVNNPEAGYPASHLETTREPLPPARAGFIGRLAQRNKAS